MGKSEKLHPIDTPPGPLGTEIIKGDTDYQEILALIHKILEPRLYLEIGVRQGNSLRLSRGHAVGVDPEFYITWPIPDRVRLFETTSDTFFKTLADDALKWPVDMAFIDGMHLFEFALRDFINIENRAHRDTVIVVDDIFPNHPLQASRDRKTRAWMGDIWKLHACLEKHRPDLGLLRVNSAPSGLMIITGLDPENRTLRNNYDSIVGSFLSTEYLAPPVSVIERDGAIAPDDPLLWNRLQSVRRNRSSRSETR